MKMKRSLWGLSVGLGLLCLSGLFVNVGCGPANETKEPPTRTEPPTRREPPKTEPAVTFHKDVRPIIEAKCQGCHQPNNIGPFSLTNYDEVSKLKTLVLESITSGRMPPWKADNSCNEYQYNYSMTPEEIKTVSEWVKLGAAEGNPADYKKIDIERPPTIREDLTIKLPVAYKPKKKGDDYRCFIMDWPKDKDTFVTGFKVNADNKAIAHHLIAYAIPPKHIATFQKYDDAEDGPGYTCYGGPTGEGGSSIAALTGIGWIGAWAPGRDTSIFPEGTGIKIQAGSKVVVQMHYSVTSDDVKPDQSSITFQTADTVKKEALIQPFANPSWVISQSMPITAGTKGEETKHSYAMDLASRFGAPILLYSVGLHMHTRGLTGHVTIERAKDSKEKDVCALRINKWDFNWQGSYGLKQPILINPGDKVRLTCTWDNTKEGQPLIDGKRSEPKDLNWGDGTYDEMCLGVLFLTAAK
jgi:hypothetical protein